MPRGRGRHNQSRGRHSEPASSQRQVTNLKQALRDANIAISSRSTPCFVTSINKDPVPLAVDVSNRSIDDNDKVPPAGSATAEDCDCEGCFCVKDSDRPVPFQPKDAAILSQLKQGKRKFLLSWYFYVQVGGFCVKWGKSVLHILSIR